MQDLGSVSWGFTHAKAPFNCLSELEDTNTNLQELFPPWSPLKVFRATAAFLPRGLKGAACEVRGSFSPLVGMKATHIVPDACWVGNLLAVLHLRPSRLAIIVPPWEFGPVLTSYRTHYRTSNSPQTAPIVGSRFSDRAHYNEFVESKAKSWVMMRRRIVLGMKGTQNRVAQSSQGEWTFWNENAPTPSRSRKSLPPVSGPPSSFCTPSSLGGLCCYLFLFSVHPPPTLVSHSCLSSSARPISHSFWPSVSYCDPHCLV